MFAAAAFQVSRRPSGVDREIEDALESRSFEPPLTVPMQLLQVASGAKASFALAVAVGLYFAIRKADWRPGVLMMVAFLGVLVIADVLKSVFARAAPSDWETGDLAGSSFPSGHVAQAVAVWGTLAVIIALRVGARPRIVVAVCAVGLIAGAALSRLILGAHWVTDVVGGIGLGGVWLVLLSAVALGLPSLGGPSRASYGDQVT
jgi:undecaprenyl-diphosphatase